MNEPLFLSSEDVEQLLDWPAMIGRLKTVYSHELPESAAPRRIVARHQDRWLRSLVAVPPGLRFMGGKLFARASSGQVTYLVTLIDQETGELCALIDGNVITAVRTAATTAAALSEVLPKNKALNIGILGSGTEARSHLTALSHVCRIASASVFSPTPAKREAFAADFSASLGVPCAALDNARGVVEGADIVVAAARSADETPIFEGAWLREGQVVVSIGSTSPDQREIDAQTISAADFIISDVPSELLEETGDMIEARKAGIDPEHKLFSISQVLRGECAAQIQAAGRILYKSVGAAVQDLAVAEVAYDAAVASGTGTTLGISFRDKKG